jgi:hypothetical protein
MSSVRSGIFRQSNDQKLDSILNEQITCHDTLIRLIGRTTKTESVQDGTYTVQYSHNGDMREHEYPKFTYISKVIPGCEFKDNLKSCGTIAEIISNLNRANSDDELLLCFVIINRILKHTHKTDNEVRLVEDYLKQHHHNFIDFLTSEVRWKERHSIKCNIL